MTTYAGVAIAQNGPADDSTRFDLTGTTYAGAVLAPAGGVDPAYPRGGSLALGFTTAAQNGRLDVTGGTLAGTIIAGLTAVIGGRVDLNGTVLLGRFIPLSAVYRNADRITLAGIATDLAGQPLRQVQLQFIGQTVQQHFFGGSTDANGIYLAYLDVGDTYDCFAYHAGTGTVWKLDHEDTSNPNTTTLVFTRVTRRGGFGEGLFRGG
ncbi:MAG: hypothetical protein ACYDBQ_03540 [Thermoplasmatota archaeon]